MSNPTTLAPPSRIAVSTLPISRVQVTLGVPSNGGVLKVSSSSATTTAADGAGLLPNTRQRSAVKASIDRPRSPSRAGEAATRAQTTTMRRAAAAACRRCGPMLVLKAGPILLEAQQAADHRCLAGLGSRVDSKRHLV